MNMPNAAIAVIFIALGISFLMLVYGIIVERRTRREIADIKKMLAEISSHVQSR
jgi:uncharacterized protein YoxC